MTTLMDSIVSGWTMEGNSNDVVGSNNGSDTGITYNSGNGKITQGAGFANSAAKIDVARSASMEAANFSVGGWFKLAATSNEILFAKNYTTSNTTPFMSYELRVTSSTTIRYDSNASGTYYNFSATTSTMSTGVWYHFMATYDGSTVTLYFNGSSVGTSSRTPPTYAGDGLFEIGNDIGGSGFAGKADEVYYWSRALTGAEITSLYNAGTGLQYPFTVAFSLVLSVGTFTLTWITSVVGRLYTLAVQYGTFLLFGRDATLEKNHRWFSPSKSSASSFANTSKNSTTYSNTSKHSTTWVNTQET